MQSLAAQQSRAAPATMQPATRLSRRPNNRLDRVACRSGRAQATTVLPQQTTSSKPKLQRHQLLKDPAYIGSKGSATVSVKDMGHVPTAATGEDLSLDAYMRLPVEQYYILDPQTIQFLDGQGDGNKFIMSVPRINLLGASLEPVIEVQVLSEADAVVLQATDCQLNATGIMGGLDSKFALQFMTRLTWNSHTHSRLPSQQPQQHKQYQVLPQPHPQQQPQQQQATQQQGAAAPVRTNGATTSSSSSRASPQSQLRTGWDRLKNVNWSMNGSSSSNGSSNNGSSTSPSNPNSTPGSITGAAHVQVWCEVVPPFQLMPREVLERSCNVVITGLVNSLLPWFMRQLAADYKMWAADAAYRAERRLRTTQKNNSSRA